MCIEFRKMNVDDRDEVISMMRNFYTTSEEIFLNDFNNCVNDSPFLEGYIFKSNDCICGYSMLAKSFSTEFGKLCIWVEDIYIKDGSRGMGIGKKFFDFITDKYKDVVFRLEVEKENYSAIRLYKEKGYEFLPYLEMLRFQSH